MTDLMLTSEELARLTGRKRPTAQSRWLKYHGIRFRINDCGEVIVARVIAEKYLGIERGDAGASDLDWPEMRRAGMLSPRGEA